LVPVPEADVIEAEKDGKVLDRQNGQRTGHTHAINEPEVKLIEVGENRYLRAAAPFSVVHQEHGPIHLPGGTYRIVHQREYAPTHFTAVRYVAD
jgi:hypothetical protein